MDLFACIGGFSTGATHAGHTIVLAVDCDPVALSIHAENHPNCRHVEMLLGPETEDDLVRLIREIVPEGTPWHLHGSPPCTKLSRARCMARQPGDAFDAEGIRIGAQEGADLVQWYLNFTKRMCPSSWSMEQVNAKLVRDLCNEQKKQYPAWFDYQVVEFLNFGVPQSRIRLIAGMPWMIERLRFDNSMRVCELVAIRDVLTPPEGAVYIRNCWARPAINGLTEEGINGEFLNEDAESRCRTFDKVSWTVMASSNLQWWDRQYQRVRNLRIPEIMALQTFPASYSFPEGVRVSDQLRGVGNAVPPLFARKFMGRYRVGPLV